MYLTLNERPAAAALGAGEGLEALELCRLTDDVDNTLGLLVPGAPLSVALGGRPRGSGTLDLGFAACLVSSLRGDSSIEATAEGRINIPYP